MNASVRNVGLAAMTTGTTSSRLRIAPMIRAAIPSARPGHHTRTPILTADGRLAGYNCRHRSTGEETTLTTSSASGIAPLTVEAGPAVLDFDFYMGTWRVHHRRLKARLVGSDEWEEFEGTSRAWPILDGAGNIDDNVLELPGGTYRAISLRTYDPVTDKWSIWWLDGRTPGRLDPPVVGGFSTASAHSSRTTPSTAGRSSSAFCGPASPTGRAAGSRPSPPMTARPGRSTGSWSRPGSSEADYGRPSSCTRSAAPSHASYASADQPRA